MAAAARGAHLTTAALYTINMTGAAANPDVTEVVDWVCIAFFFFNTIKCIYDTIPHFTPMTSPGITAQYETHILHITKHADSPKSTLVFRCTGLVFVLITKVTKCSHHSNATAGVQTYPENRWGNI